MVETPHRRRRSHRRVRTRVYVEGPDGGVTERANNVAAEGEREVWVQVGDAADVATRQDYADALLDLHSTPRESIEVGVGGHAHQAYADYAPGDTVAAEGHDQMRTARAESITMRLGDQVDTDVTLTSRAQLQIEDLETLLERMGDASRAANPSLQKRHGLISADKIESGRIRVDQDIASSDWDEAQQTGWRIRGSGDSTFNSVTVRGLVDASTVQASDFISSDGTGGRVEIRQNPGYQIDWYNGDGDLTGRAASGGAGITALGIQATMSDLNLGTAGTLRVRAAPFGQASGWAPVAAGRFAVQTTGGLVVSGSGATADRPDALGQEGAYWWDTDLGRPIFSDGADWRFADGSLV